MSEAEADLAPALPIPGAPRADVEVVTFGCRLNAYESEVIRQKAAEAGLTDTIIVNTCAVTAEAERQARQAIRKLRRENPSARLVVTGCGAQIDPESYAGMGEVDQVIGNEEKLKAESWRFLSNGGPPSERVRVNDIMSVKETASHMIAGFGERARAFVQVQNGCDHRCTFCIIPYGRGNSRSVPMGEVVAEVRQLVAAGYSEVVLSGVDVTSYGPDLPGSPSFGQMIRRLLAAVPELPRLRLSSLDAVEMDEDLWRLIENEPRLMPHLHLSLQSGDDMILKRMKRRHSVADALAFVERARKARPEIVFGADLIAGFPTETDQMAANTLATVRALGLTYLHVFPYSARKGTPAARMPQVPMPLRKERAAALRALGSEALATYLASQVGTEANVLAEKPEMGRTEQFAQVRLTGAEPGRITRMRITGVEGDFLTAEAA
jgi:threonylcarbamoyladenosine tRNA methylthiotransferase MtaB